jgi:hypothetical protein
MSRRIVSWSTNEPRVSPVQSTASAVSVVSIKSIVSDTHMMTTEATGAQTTELGAKLTTFPGSANPTSEDSFVPHDTYFFKDGNITFLVRDALYCALSSLKKAVGRRHTLLCSSVLFLSGLRLLLYQIWPARRPRSRTIEYYHIIE